MSKKTGIMKLSRMLSLILIFLCGCIHHETNVQIRPSAAPDRTLTKTAIAPAAASRRPEPGNDPWAVCAELPDSEPVLMKVSKLENEEFRRRVQITFMIRNEAADTVSVASRCMNGKVYVCSAEEQQNCLEKLDFSTEPVESLAELCAVPELDGLVPALSAIGWNSAYAWICRDGEAVILRQAAEADAAGYDSSIWTEIPAPDF